MLDAEITSDTNNVTTTLQAVDTGNKIVKHGKSFRVQLDKASDYRVKVEADGYETESLVIQRSFQPVTLLNLLWGLTGIGLVITAVGFLVDFSSQHAWAHSTKYLNVTPSKKRD